MCSQLVHLDRDAVAQILAYMGDLMLTEKAVRGLLVAGDFLLRTIAAARAIPNLQLKDMASNSRLNLLARHRDLDRQLAQLTNPSGGRVINDVAQTTNAILIQIVLMLRGR